MEFAIIVGVCLDRRISMRDWRPHPMLGYPTMPALFPIVVRQV